MTQIQPGMLVECIRSDFDFINEVLPVCGHVYTVRECLPPEYVSAGIVTIRLVEITNPQQLYMEGVRECSFDLDFFRPVDSTALDIFRTTERETVDG